MDTLLSSQDYSYFESDKRIFIGSKTFHIHQLLTRIEYNEYREGNLKMIRQMDSVHAFPHADKNGLFCLGMGKCRMGIQGGNSRLRVNTSLPL